jgi:hypothetical protein
MCDAKYGNFHIKHLYYTEITHKGSKGTKIWKRSYAIILNVLTNAKDNKNFRVRRTL